MHEQTSCRENDSFVSQLPPAMLESMKSIAREEGKQLQSLFEEAVTLYLQHRSYSCQRTHVFDALEKSIAEHDELYRKLAQ